MSNQLNPHSYAVRTASRKTNLFLSSAVRVALAPRPSVVAILAASSLIGLAASAGPPPVRGPSWGAQAFFPPVIQLEQLGAGEITAISGMNSGDAFGYSVGAAGDVNGDGIDDILIGAYGANVSYVIFGSEAFLPAHRDIADLGSDEGFAILGVGPFGRTSGVGDFNDDGLDDVAIGNPFSNVTHVVFGGAEPLSRIPDSITIDTTDAAGSTLVGGFLANGVTELQIEEFGLTKGETTVLAITGETGEFSPYDQPEGVGIAFFDVAEQALRFTVDTFDSESPDVDLFVGRDDNGDGEIAPEEERCNSGSPTSIEFCEIPEPESGSWWVAVINFFASAPGATDNTSVRATSVAPTGGNFSGTGPAGPITELVPFDLELSWNLDDAVAGDVYLGELFLGTDVGEAGNLGSVPVTLNYAVTGSNQVVSGDGGGPVQFDVNNIDGSNGVTLPGNYSGWSVGKAGDVNGDNVSDIVIGTPFSGGGRAYLVFGSDAGLPAEIDLGALDGNDGVLLEGGGGIFTGYSTAGVGDVNGDEFDDVVIANNPVRVVFGRSQFPAVVDLTALDGSDGFSLTGPGRSAGGAGDLNADGLADVVVADPGVGGDSAGRSYVVFGDAGGFPAAVSLLTLNGNNGFSISGADFDDSGYSASGAGDINGDGVDDLAIGGRFGFETFVVFGDAGGFPADLPLASLDGANGFVAEDANESPMAAGDFNNDGVPDFVVGETHLIPTGRAYVVFGRQAIDTDADGLFDNEDNCTEVANPDQRDANSDGIGNLCDADLSENCFVDFNDFVILRNRRGTANPIADLDGDGIVSLQDFEIMQTQIGGPPGPSGVPNDCD